jgi:hypothetical protein
MDRKDSAEAVRLFTYCSIVRNETAEANIIRNSKVFPTDFQPLRAVRKISENSL